MENKVIIIKDIEENFEYATLIVPSNLADDIAYNIGNMAERIYSFYDQNDALFTEWDNLYDYILAHYGQYIDHDPVIVEVY